VQESQTVIEKSFFNKEAATFNKMFHNGGFKSMQVISNEESVRKQAEKYDMNPKVDFATSLTAEELKNHDLTIAYIADD
jgi:hypothetical protein